MGDHDALDVNHKGIEQNLKHRQQLSKNGEISGHAQKHLGAVRMSAP